MKRIIVAIDGPAASGKSTTAMLLAKKLGFMYLDTGAMYRACALQALREGIQLQDSDAINDLMNRIQLSVKQSCDNNLIFLADEDVSSAIRSPEISALASAISALPEVRHKMVNLQRKLGSEGGVVLDGRDIGTVVFPDAECKFFMVADLLERAKRRFLELQAKGCETPLEKVMADLEERDKADSSRAMAPLKPAPDAVLIDTSSLSINAQVELLHQVIVNIAGYPANIRLAKYSGYCFGVRRAIQLAMGAATEGKEVVCYGELIHNPTVGKQLSEKGIKVVTDIDLIVNSIVIIRSHGITASDYNKLIANGNEIIDTTCPYVKRTHELLRCAVAEGYPVVVLGDSKHPEVIGMLSYGDEKTQVVAPGEEIVPVAGNRLCVISQTTQQVQNLVSLVSSVLPRYNELKVYNTICLATSQRQCAASELAKNSDLMIVIGGYNSSNTRALASLCENICLTHHIESDLELEGIDFSGYGRIGLSAGASTPEEVIIKVYNKIKQKSGESGLVTSIDQIPLFKEESC